MTEATWASMAYDQDFGGWVVQMDGKTFGLHCGECMAVRVGGHSIPCRIELDRDWYLIMGGTSFTLRKKQIYQIQFV